MGYLKILDLGYPAPLDQDPHGEVIMVVLAPVRRGTSNSNARGSSKDRARRRAWLLCTFGNGRSCPCYRCGKRLTKRTLTVDRKIPGVDGGTYRRDNIRPACAFCNSSTGGALAHRA